MQEMAEQLKEMGPEKIKAENKKLKPTLDKMMERKQKK
jgi:hypothetical protein